VALTTLQAQSLLTTGTNFLARVQYAMVLTAENIAAESTGTALHYQRMQLAVAVLNNPNSYLTMFAQAVLCQLTLASTNLVGGTDTDSSDAALATACSALWNSLFLH
jgi:hypothetical protein